MANHSSNNEATTQFYVSANMKKWRLVLVFKSERINLNR